jgi:hypothetical protein
MGVPASEWNVDPGVTEIPIEPGIPVVDDLTVGQYVYLGEVEGHRLLAYPDGSRICILSPTGADDPCVQPGGPPVTAPAPSEGLWLVAVAPPDTSVAVVLSGDRQPLGWQAPVSRIVVVPVPTELTDAGYSLLYTDADGAPITDSN